MQQVLIDRKYWVAFFYVISCWDTVYTNRTIPAVELMVAGILCTDLGRNAVLLSVSGHELTK